MLYTGCSGIRNDDHQQQQQATTIHMIGNKGTGQGSGKGVFKNSFGCDNCLLSKLCRQLMSEIDIFVSAALKLCVPMLYTYKLNGPTHHDPNSKVLAFQQFGFSLSFFANIMHQDSMDNDIGPHQLDATFGRNYIRQEEDKPNLTSWGEDVKWKIGEKIGKWTKGEWKRSMRDIRNCPLLSVNKGGPGSVLLYVSKKGCGKKWKDSELPRRNFHTFGVIQELPQVSGIVWLNTAAVAHHTLAHPDSKKNKKLTELRNILKKGNTAKGGGTVADKKERLELIKEDCPLQSCCAHEDLFGTFKGGATVENNYKEVNEIREPNKMVQLYDFTKASNNMERRQEVMEDEDGKFRRLVSTETVEGDVEIHKVGGFDDMEK